MHARAQTVRKRARARLDILCARVCNCEEGHRYLFSEVKMTWEEARGECLLYGGWLVDLRTRKEQNCLLRYAQAAGVTDDWYWHDGNQHTRLFPGLLLYFIIVNSLETHGVFMHAKDNSEAEWVNDWSCATD